ncbi:MAG: class I SAM-dependent rRNA methyltransferase [Verrucomicrobiae bacterium]|nr:class I SAM-dependent rRNA methyltransferase [Verrucomicrobiae bacterium]
MAAIAYVKTSRLGRILAGHPWVYASDLLPLKKSPADGETVVVRAQEGFFVGKGVFNSRSEIRVRILSRNKDDELDDAWLRKRLQAALDFRNRYWKRPARRLVWSEADGLSGLVVDQYGDWIVAQVAGLAFENRRDALASALRDLTNAHGVLLRHDGVSRKKEGLAEGGPVQLLCGQDVPDRLDVKLGSAIFHVDLREGHKTGMYLDQQENWQAVGGFCGGRRVLDCFSYQGGFAIHAALAGAKEVHGVDISEESVAQAKANAEVNKAACSFTVANVFDHLTEFVGRGEIYDLVILDPPSFTRSRDKLQEALRGYKQIHLQALRLLAPGGLLATFCCSHHVDAETFRAVALDAAFDRRRTLRLLRSFGQPIDHPIVPAIPETEYLKGFLFEAL